MGDRHAIPPQIIAYLNAGASTNVSQRTVQQIIVNMDFLPIAYMLITLHKALPFTLDPPKSSFIVDEWNNFTLTDGSGSKSHRMERTVLESRESTKLTCQQGTDQYGRASEIVWEVCYQRDTRHTWYDKINL
ncbi:hypothetical protein TNCV_1028881 [Trichonephila clavipes]|nr:hypothetical protein TNCV_1028881 [Trichonephila clavipes]